MAKEEKNKRSEPTVPQIVYAEASIRSKGGVSLFEAPEIVARETIQKFFSEPQLISAAVDLLRSEGFQILQVGQTTVTIAAPAEIYERVFKTKVVAEERETIKKEGEVTTATFLECPDTDIPGLIDPSKSSLADVLEGIALEEPVYYFASPFPPTKSYWHLDVPSGVSLGINADRAHKAGFTGRGVKVVMVDTGWFRHPFFVQRAYRSNPVILGPATTNPDIDEHGHGTGESANIFSVAPDVDFTMVKLSFVNSIGAFKTAVGLRPDIISCSWGKHKPFPPLSAADQALAAAIANAVSQGIIVIFSAGNGQWGFPGQHPDVISAGGVYMHPDGSFEATPYASGFESNIYPGRVSPDVCGLVGLLPRAMYIMLPVEPNDYLDRNLSGGSHPSGDETANNDGWAAFSGTSAAAPQLAGVCALVKQASPRLSPDKLRDTLKRTAKDVTVGNSAQGNPAQSGIDLATGHGLANAFYAAVINTKGNFEVITREGNRMFFYWREDKPPWTWHGPFEIASGISGNPVFIQSNLGQKGNFELVVPLSGGGLAHYVRDNDTTGLPWHGPKTFGSGNVEAVTLIQSNFGRRGHLEVVAREGNRLVFYWREDISPYTWHGPYEIVSSGVTGNPSLIQSNLGQKGNFELVVPLSGGGLAHYVRDNDTAGISWYGPNIFGSGNFEAVAMIQSSYGCKGNLEVVARKGNRLFFYWRIDGLPYAWFGPAEIIKGVSGIPSLIQSNFKDNLELVVPLEAGGLGHFLRDVSSVRWNGPYTFSSGVVVSACLIQSNFSTFYKL